MPFFFGLLVLCAASVRAEQPPIGKTPYPIPVVEIVTSSSPIETDNLPEPEQPQLIEEDSEERGILPPGEDVQFSSAPITPITHLPQTPPLELAKQELQRAERLYQKTFYEAASDWSLAAYDDLRALRRPRNKKDRTERKKTVYRAAEIYILSSIAYIKDYVSRHERSADALLEGKVRVDDLRDVSRNYPDLDALVKKAKEEL